MIKLTVLLMAGVALGAIQAKAADDVAALKAQAATITQGFAAQMKGELEKAMQSGGPVHAITVCNERAAVIAAEHARASGWTVGRTSLKLRQPANAPDAWEQATLAEFESRKAAGEAADTLVKAEAVAGRFRFAKAIPTAELCTTCHGRDIKPEVAARLEKLYPADKATGFRPGDLRGAFTLSKAM
jgi:hypothetical protein